MSDTPTPPTTRDAEQDLAVCNAATPGPWQETESIDGLFVRHDSTPITPEAWMGEADRKFVALARTALPYWIAEADSERQRADDAESLVQRIEAVILAQWPVGNNAYARQNLPAIVRAIAEECDRVYLRGTSEHEHLDRCPTYHDGCNCTVDVLEHNLKRAEVAEKRLAEVERERDAALAEIHNCPKCGKSCKQCDCYDAELKGAKAENAKLTRDLATISRHRDESLKLLRRHDDSDECEQAKCGCCCATLPELVAATIVENERLRKFLQFDTDPSPNGWAWCCWCQESHPIDTPHVDDAGNKARMDGRAKAMAEIRGLRAEIERLAKGDFTDKTLSLLVAQIDKKVEQSKRFKNAWAEAKAENARLTEERDRYIALYHDYKDGAEVEAFCGDEARDEIMVLQTENTRLAAELEAANKEIDLANQQLNAVNERVRVLEEALKPFAEISKAYPSPDVTEDTWPIYIKLGYCRNADRVLAGEGAK